MNHRGGGDLTRPPPSSLDPVILLPAPQPRAAIVAREILRQAAADPLFCFPVDSTALHKYIYIIAPLPSTISDGASHVVEGRRDSYKNHLI